MPQPISGKSRSSPHQSVLDSNFMEDGRQNKQGIYADAYASPPGRIKTNKKYESSTFSYSKNQNFDSRAADLGDCIPGDRLSPFRKRQSSESKQHYSSEHNAFRN